MKFIKFITRNYTLRDHFLIVQSLYKKNTSIPGFYYNDIVEISYNGLVDIYVSSKNIQDNISRLRKNINNKQYLENKIKEGNIAINNLLDLPYAVLKNSYNLDNNKIIEVIQTIKNKMFKFSSFIDFTHYIDSVGFKINDSQIKRFSNFHDQRKEAFLKVFVFLDKLFEKKLKGTKIINKKLNFITLEEAVDFFNGQIDEKYINAQQKKRMKKYIGIFKNNKEKIITDNFNSVLAKIEKNLEKRKNDKVIKGKSINKGVVTGTVKIITQITDYTTIPSNSIIVTQMTTPEMYVYLKKAKALITDEGGILCHAAIFAREFNKIAIIGTKIATQVLQDGDRVEVDANQGIVKKI